MIDQEKLRIFHHQAIASGSIVKEVNTLGEAVKKACEMNEMFPVYCFFQDGFVVPKGVKFYDAFFIAIQQTDKASPDMRLQEASMIKQVYPDYKFDRDTEISLAFYRNEVLRQQPSKAQEFSKNDLVSTYKILSKMEIKENKDGLPCIEAVLREKFPQILDNLKAHQRLNIDTSLRSL